MKRLMLPMLGLGVALAATPAAAQLRAGAARVNITPPAHAFPFTFEQEKPIVGVHDDVFARALVLENNGKRVALVSIEVTTVPEAPETIRAIAEAAGLPEANVMVTASHTHNVPIAFYHGPAMTPVRRREYDRVRLGAVEAVKIAAAALKPARIAFKRGEAHVNMNNGENSGYKGWPDPKGFSDKSLDVIRVESLDGAPVALMLNYATHAEVMFRSVTKDGGYEVTGDLPGAVSRILESSAAGAPVVLFTSAAEGDQLSVFKSLQPAAELPASDEGAGGWSLLNLMARRLATSALHVLAAMPPGSSSAPIAVARGGATCPGQKFNVERPSGRILGIEDTPPVTVPLQLFRIGDIALAGVAGDVASQIGASIKDASSAPNTTVVTMLAGSVGYILPDSAFREPGHGALGSRIKPGCVEQAVPRAAADLLGKAQ